MKSNHKPTIEMDDEKCSVIGRNHNLHDRDRPKWKFRRDNIISERRCVVKAYTGYQSNKSMFFFSVFLNQYLTTQFSRDPCKSSFNDTKISGIIWILTASANFDQRSFPSRGPKLTGTSRRCCVSGQSVKRFLGSTLLTKRY